MTAHPHSSLRRLGVALAVPLAALLALVTPATVAQSAPHPELTVMTRNLYLGSSLSPAIEAGNLEELVAAVAEIYGTSVFTDFPTRAAAVADEIAATQPDLIGLQEVSRWSTEAVAAPGATAPSFDFLEILLAALAAKGLSYSVGGVVDNALIGPLPLIAPDFGCLTITPTPGGLLPDCVVTFADRDVILVNDDTAGLSVERTRSGRFDAQQVLDTPSGPLSFDRGWVSVDARYLGKSFRLVNTHLETEDFPAVQEAQTAEFLAGPAKGGQVIATGDFNSAADGSSTNSYAQLTAPPAFTDVWSVNPGDDGATCCQNSTLTNPASALGSRIDLILTRGPIRPVSAEVVGNTPFRAQEFPPRPIWASDHAGVVATVTIR
jgi:endonuclease/exonuclease/phosphatase family metal-dependent hydrolase